MKKIVFSVALFVSLIGQTAFAVFNNSGTMRSKKANFMADVLNNTGTIEGSEYVLIKCDKLTGNGLIKGPKMEITAVECDYEGVIDCSQECILITNTSNPEQKFRFIGGGELIIKKCQ